MKKYASAYSNWLDLYMNYTYPYYEVAISGKEVFLKEYDFTYTEVGYVVYMTRRLLMF